MLSGSRALACVALVFSSQVAWAEETDVVQQVLDRVVVYNGGTAVEMQFDDPEARAPYFYNYDLDASVGLRSCQLNGTRGLYCLDGLSVRRWQDPAEGGPGEVEFRCDNEALTVARKRIDSCSAMAVAQNGDVWVSGRRGTAYSLIRLHEKDLDGNCRPYSRSLLPVASSRYCFKEYASGRPLLLKLVVVEGEEAERFSFGAGTPSYGVLALDSRTGVSFYGSSLGAGGVPVPEIDLAVGKSVWGLLSRESLTDLALLQVPNPDGGSDQTDNLLLVVTNSGRVLARQTDAGTPVFTVEAFNAPDERFAPPTGPCDATATQRYGLAASAKTGRVYLSDRNFCQAVALRPLGPPFVGLVNVADEDDPNGSDLTLSTSNTTIYPDDPLEPPVHTVGTYPPDGVTVAPGIVVDLSECEETGSCTLIAGKGKDEGPFAELLNVELNSAESRMVLFQVRNIPDCRHLPDDPVCVAHPDAIVDSPVPGEQYLDVARLLPSEVTDQFRATNALPPGLPPLLISPQYRGQADKNYRFGALIGITEPGVVFKNVFDAIFKVAQLSGSELGCRLGYGLQTPLTNPQARLAELLRWDVVTWTSERHVAPGGPNGLDDRLHSFVDTIVNSGCGSTQTRIISKSMLAYDLEVAYQGRDDVFALLVTKLMRDLVTAQTELTCKAGVDSAGSDPLRSAFPDSACPVLNESLLNSDDKLTKCVGATRQPKTSALDQNCQSFEVQFSAYRAALGDILPASATLDPANRIGGLKARSETLWHVYKERFLPSVPLGGFVSPTP